MATKHDDSGAKRSQTCTSKHEALSDELLLYLVTDTRWLEGRSLEECVQQAVEGGITFLQLREKDLSSEQIAEQAKQLLPLCRKANIPLVIDDDIEAALASGADGVHVGQSDASCELARSVLGADSIIGVSAQTVEQAISAQEAGADYLGVGAMFITSTKTDADAVTTETLSEICSAVDIPVVAIGGIDDSNVSELERTGIAGIAVVSAILAAEDIKAATTSLLNTIHASIGK